MDDKLLFNDKNYISAKRASEISGYNSDYLGQLCRGEKLQCRLVSRTWFIEESSLLKHLKNNGRKKTSPLILKAEAQEKEKIFLPEDKKLAATLLRSNLVQTHSFFEKVFNRKILVASFTTLIISLSISATIISLSSPLMKNGETAVLKPVETITANVRDFLSGSRLIERYESSPLSRAYWRIVYFKNNLKNKLTSIFKEGPVVRKGSVVVPTPKTGREEDIDELKKHIEESFSDEVQITTDPEDTSGVIKPVFREDTGEEYLYVMVPITEDEQ